MQIGSAISKKGEIAYGKITVGHTMGRIPIDIPVVIVEGLEDGPTLAVSAAVHGAELIGAMGIHEFLFHVDPKQLKGRIVLVPVANQSAFEFGQRNTKWDEMNLNRHGLGRIDGAITERIAYYFAHDIVLKSDAHVDIHSGTEDGFVWYTIYDAEVEGVDPKVTEMAKRMAVAFGLTDIMAKCPDRWAGGYGDDVLRAGVPSIAVEIGGGGDYFINGKQQIEMCAQGIRNVAVLMGIMDGEIVAEAEDVTFWRGEAEIIAGGVGGLLRTHVQIGDFCPKGSVWGVLYDPFTAQEVETLLLTHRLLPTPQLAPVARGAAGVGRFGDGQQVRGWHGESQVRPGRRARSHRDGLQDAARLRRSPDEGGRWERYQDWTNVTGVLRGSGSRWRAMDWRHWSSPARDTGGAGGATSAT